jgi:hypothetical protein
MSLARNISTAEVPVKKTRESLNGLLDTLKTTAKW